MKRTSDQRPIKVKIKKIKNLENIREYLMQKYSHRLIEVRVDFGLNDYGRVRESLFPIKVLNQRGEKCPGKIPHFLEIL